MKIIIIDDDQIVCRALKEIVSSDPSIKVIATGHSFDDAVKFYREFKPDVILLDIQLGHKTGIMAAKDIIAKDKSAKILFLTTFTDTKYISESLKLGAKGYILKQDFNSIVPALKAVFSGQNVFGGDIIDKLPKAFSSTEEIFENYMLGKREIEILKLLAKGNNNREIANLLYLSEGTVRNYISQLLEKLNLRDRTQLAIFYYNSSAFKE